MPRGMSDLRKLSWLYPYRSTPMFESGQLPTPKEWMKAQSSNLIMTDLSPPYPLTDSSNSDQQILLICSKMSPTSCIVIDVPTWNSNAFWTRPRTGIEIFRGPTRNCRVLRSKEIWRTTATENFVTIHVKDRNEKRLLGV